MSAVKEQLQKRKQTLLKKIKPLRLLERELEEVESLLASYDRHGQEMSGHEPGCRCRKCDPSW